MTDLEFCDWVRLRAEATNGPGVVHQRLIEATDRLAKSASEVERLRKLEAAAIKYRMAFLDAEEHEPEALGALFRAAREAEKARNA